MEETWNLPEVFSEEQQKLEKYRVKMHPIEADDRPEPIIMVAQTGRGADVVTYNVVLLNFHLEIVLCNISGCAPSKQATLGNGAYGQVRIETWQERKFAVKRQIAVKSYGPRCGQQVHTEQLENVLVEYAITKICSLYGIGPEVDVSTGFDILCYADCIQFSLELCRPATRQDIQQEATHLQKLVDTMHSLRLIHRDIKPQNILFSESKNCCVFSDFGLSHFVKEVPGERSEAFFEGTRKFMSREVLELEMAKGKRGLVDLYHNDQQALEKTFDYCSEKVKLKLPTSISEAKGGESMINQFYNRQGANDDFFYQLDHSVRDVEEIPPDDLRLEVSRRHESSSRKELTPIDPNISEFRMEYSKSSSSSDTNYEYLSLKYYLSKAHAHKDMNIERSLSMIDDNQVCELLELTANSLDSHKTERVLRAINTGGIHLPKKAEYLMPYLRVQSRYAEFNPENLCVQSESERSIRNKLRIYGYTDKVLAACQNCLIKTPFVKEVEHFLEKYGKPILSRRSKLRKIIGMLKGSRRLQMLSQWEKVYRSQQTKSIAELMSIYSELYESEKDPTKKEELLNNLPSYTDFFTTGFEARHLDEILQRITQIKNIQVQAQDFSREWTRFRQLEISLAERVAQTQEQHEQLRLCIILIWERRNEFMKKVSNNPVMDTWRLIISQPPPQLANRIYRIKRRDYDILRSTQLQKAREETIIIIAEMCPVGSELWASQLKVLTYLQLILKNNQKALRNQQLRLEYLLKNHESEDFSIVESHLLLAWAYSHLDFDLCRRVRDKGFQIYTKMTRSEWESFVMVDLCLHIDLRMGNFQDVDIQIEKLKNILDANPHFRGQRAQIWKDCEYRGAVGFNRVSNYVTQIYLAHHQAGSPAWQKIQLYAIVDLSLVQKWNQARMLLDSRSWDAPNQLFQLVYQTIRAQFSIMDRNIEAAKPHIEECQRLITLIPDHPESVYNYLSVLSNAYARIGHWKLSAAYISRQIKTVINPTVQNMGSIIFKHSARLCKSGDYKECIRVSTEHLDQLGDTEKYFLYEMIIFSYGRLGARSQSRKYLNEYAMLLEKTGGEFSTFVSNFYSVKGVLFKMEGLYDKALEFLRLACQRQQDLSLLHRQYFRMFQVLELTEKFREAYRCVRTSIALEVQYDGWRQTPATKMELTGSILPKMVDTLFKVGYSFEGTILYRSFPHASSSNNIEQKIDNNASEHTALDAEDKQFIERVSLLTTKKKRMSKTAFRSKLNLYSILVINPNTYSKQLLRLTVELAAHLRAIGAQEQSKEYLDDARQMIRKNCQELDPNGLLTTLMDTLES